MDKTTSVILLISLAAALLAGVIVIFKRFNDPDYTKRIENEKDRPLVQNSESMGGFIGRHLSAVPLAIVLILFLVLLDKCGVT